MKKLEALVVQDEIARGLPLPSPGAVDDVCYDLPVAERVVIPKFSGADVKTGVRIVPPKGYYFRVVGKGSSAKHGLSFALEVIDPGFRGPITLHPWNSSAHDVVVERGQSIAQLELVHINRCTLVPTTVDKLDVTPRGEGRMNSTGRGLDTGGTR